MNVEHLADEASGLLGEEGHGRGVPERAERALHHEERGAHLVGEVLEQTSGAILGLRLGGDPIGGLAPAHFEAITLGTWRCIDQIEGVKKNKVKDRLIKCLESQDFRQFVGPGSNSLTKFNGRIDTVEKALLELAE